MRRFWSLFLVGLPACSGMATSPAQFRGDAAVARMRAAYSSVQAYEDKGVVTVLDGAGPKPGREFSTSFTRDGQFRFSAQASPQEKWMILSTAAKTELVALNEARPAKSVGHAAGALSGVTRLSSLVVPTLLGGEDFCDCLERAPQILPAETIDGVPMLRLAIRQEDGDQLVLWLDGASFLRRVDWDLASRPNSPWMRVSISYREVTHR